MVEKPCKSSNYTKVWELLIMGKYKKNLANNLSQRRETEARMLELRPSPPLLLAFSNN